MASLNPEQLSAKASAQARRGNVGLTDNTSRFATPLAGEPGAAGAASLTRVKRAHQHELWQLEVKADGGQYCRACGETLPGAPEEVAEDFRAVDGHVPSHVAARLYEAGIETGAEFAALRDLTDKHRMGRLPQRLYDHKGHHSIHQAVRIDQMIAAKLAGVAPDPKKAAATQETPKKVHVSGRWGGSDVTPGVLDEAASQAFMTGQCVAFAAEYADHIGADVTYLTNRKRNEVIHAYVIDPKTGKAIDIRGARPVHQMTEMFLRTKVSEDIEIVTVTPAEARNIKKSRYGDSMFKPATKVAKTFVHAVEKLVNGSDS